MTVKAWLLLALGAVMVAIIARDVLQRKEPVLRVFPLVGWLRPILGRAGPKLRQYLIAGDLDERPFTRVDRTWVSAAARGETSQIAFGAQSEAVARGQELVIRFRTFPAPDGVLELPDVGEGSLKVIGGARGRAHPYRPTSIVNISGMSFGALSGPAVEGLNRAAELADCYHNTGEGGISDYHLSGGDLVFQIGSGYFGCRDDAGNFDIERLKDLVAGAPVRALEIKLSQGAKPGMGGFLPGAKVTPEIARYRGIPVGEDCASPARHSQFHDADSLLDWVEHLAAETGLPVGIKSAVGDTAFWRDLSQLMVGGNRGVDDVAIDGGEGGTGAALPVFADAVGYPFHAGFQLVHEEFRARDLTGDVVFIGAGKLGITANAARAFALGVDVVNVGRTAMLAMGCIQALKCHTGACPTGIATQRTWLSRGIAPEAAATAISNYVRELRRELFAVADACGVGHPGRLTPEDLAYVTPQPTFLGPEIPLRLTATGT